MTDPLDSVQNRLRWINRGILAAAVLVVIGLSVLVMRTMHGPKTQTKVERVDLPGAAVGRASAAAKPASAPQHPNMPASDVSVHVKTPAPASAASQAVPVVSPTLVDTASQPASDGYSVAPTQAEQPDMVQKRLPAAVTKGPEPSTVSSHRASAQQPSESHERAATAPRKAQRQSKARADYLCERAGWYVQVGAFAHKSSFESLQSRLKRDGFKTCKAPQAPQGLNLLLVGAYASREEALQAQKRLKKLLGGSSYLRHLPAAKNKP